MFAKFVHIFPVIGAKTKKAPHGRKQTEKEKILRMLDLGVIEPFI
jgi:hypothetical protein